MRSNFNLVAAAIASSLLINGASAAVATHVVAVGQGGLLMTPNATIAAAGDIIQFNFYTGFHDVVQGSFDAPCHVGSVTNGFHSSFMRVTAPAIQGTTSFQVTVNDTNPIWYYCSQQSAVNHCAAGMSGVINPPASGNTLALYQQNSKALNSSETPAGTGGGVLIAVAGINGTASASSSASAASSAASSLSSAVSSAIASVTSAAASATSAAAASSSSKAAAPAMTLSWEVLAAAGAVVGGAVAYL